MSSDPVVSPFIPAEPALHPSVGNSVKFFRANPEGEFLELPATVFDDGAGGVILQVVNQNNQVEWHDNPEQGVGDGQWQQ